MRRKRRALGAPAVIAMVALISACGSSAPAGTDTGGGNPMSPNHDKAVKFAKCMRRNGVSEFPDPPASGGFTIDGIANGSSLDLNAPAFKTAMSACKELEPAGFTGTRRTAQQMDAALKFALCMREHGVKDFPDPTNGQPLVDTNNIPSSAQPGGMTILNAAMHTCRTDAAAAMARR